MKITETEIKDLYVLETEPFVDERGSFARFFCARELQDILGGRQIVNMNQSSNIHAGTVRGLHFQAPPYAEMKMVRCVKGRIFDVAVDIRQGSPTFLKWFGVELTEENGKTLVIPEGFAHGFQALDDGAVVSYLVTEHFNAEADRGLNPLDPSLVIKWPLEVKHMSPKDSGKPYIFMGIQL